MSYQVIARKWRPFTFDEVVGQAHVTTPLRNAINSNRIPHAILLTGPRGTGKTTLARILACCLNATDGPTETPSKDDPACVDIQAGRGADVLEMDAASRTGVDDVREIIDSIHYAPSPGKWRIFIVDEVHMLSGPAFNSLLKTLEEPPPNSLFIFCTTNPEKIPFTVVSRCQRYDLRRIATSETANKLAEIAEAEGISISKNSLLAVARAGDGSMRDAQTLLDQLIAFGGSEIDDERVAEVLDLVDRNVLVAMVRACADADAPALLETVRRAFEAGVDPKRLGSELLGVLRDLVVLSVAPGKNLVEGADAEIKELREIAERSEPIRLRRMFRALVREQEDLAWAPDPFSVLEMALLRLATMPSGEQVEALLARIDALEKRLRDGVSGGGGGTGAGSAGSSQTPGAGSKSRPARADAGGGGGAAAAKGSTTGGDLGHRAGAGTATGNGAGPAQAGTGTQDAGAGKTGAASLDARPAPAAAGNAEGAGPAGDTFERLCEYAGRENPGAFAALHGGVLLEESEDTLCIGIESKIGLERLRGRHRELESTCRSFFGRDLRVELRAVGSAAETDDKGAQDQKDNEAAQAAWTQKRKNALAHPAINEAREVLGGEIIDIQPPKADA